MILLHPSPTVTDTLFPYTTLCRSVGWVRGDGGLTELFLDHHPAMTAAGLTALAEEAARRWTLDASTLIHRVGAMAPGDTIVLVLASSRHRAEALAACEYLIDRLKKIGRAHV